MLAVLCLSRRLESRVHGERGGPCHPHLHAGAGRLMGDAGPHSRAVFSLSRGHRPLLKPTPSCGARRTWAGVRVLGIASVSKSGYRGRDT